MPTFLELYGKLSAGNEAPRIFHMWAGLSIISSIMGRQVWLPRGNVPPVHLNMYVIFTTPPGTKKTTAMLIAKDFIRSLKEIPMAGSNVTKEQMIVTMDTTKDSSPCRRAFKWRGKTITYSHYCIFSSEFINQINAGFNPIGMIDFFTDVWDAKEISDETKNKGCYKVENPFVNLLGCMTDYTAKNLNTQKIVSAGMLRRCLFVLAEDSGIDIPRPELMWTPEQDEIRIELTERAKALRFVQGEFNWTPEANAFWTQLYLDNGRKKRAETNPIKKEFYQTRPEYIQKVAMLLQLSDDPTTLVLTAENLAIATKLISEVEDGSAILFEGSGRNELSAIGHEIARTCESAKAPIFEKILFKAHMQNLSWMEFTQIVDDMIRIGRLRRVEISKGASTMIYITTPQIAKSMLKPASTETPSETAASDSPLPTDLPTPPDP